MKLVTYRDADGAAPAVGAVVGAGVVRLPYADMLEAIAAQMEGRLELGEETVPLVDARLGPPVPVPTKIAGVGLNYLDHAAETELTPPEVPLVFAKFPSSIIGPGETIRLHDGHDVDYEAELGVVIGRQGRDIPVGRAAEHVVGYVNVNDVSARDMQFGEGGQWTRGKSLDTFAPIGPYLVTADEIADPQNLTVRCELNGEIVQESNTSEMVFSVAELVSFISGGTTLLPGDLIATGTPPGVGMARKPPRWLRPGDRVVVEVEGLGRLENVVDRIEAAR